MAAINYQRRAHWLLLGLSSGLVLLAGVLLWLNSQFNWQFDWTHGTRNTLTATSQQLLGQMQQPLLVEAYFDSNAQIREQVRRFIARYQRFKDDIALNFIDTQLGREQLDKQGFSHLGQLKISYAEKQQMIARLNEQSFTGALFKLVRQRQPWVVMVQGHGERDPLDTGSNGFSRFAHELKQIGVHVQPLNLLKQPIIPDNTKVLLLAGARNAYLAGELQLIENYIQAGGNLLWLREPAKQNYFKSLDSLLHVGLISGVIIDANTRLRVVLGIKHPAVIPVVDYQAHGITTALKTHSLFPFAAGLKIQDESPWHAEVLLKSLDRSWAEVSDLSKKELTFEQDTGDTRGPLNLGVALTRIADTIEQRVAIIGDSDFLANGYLGNGANLSLGLNIINWLTQDESLIAISRRAAPDQTIELNDSDVIFIAVLLLIIIPAVLIATGFALRWLRHRN